LKAARNENTVVGKKGQKVRKFPSRKSTTSSEKSQGGGGKRKSS